ncbi:MAG: hypothetical protein Q7S26_00810 [bacterium]|nr:hypothetical protein [bacterium]
MSLLPASITIVIALLAVFLIFITGLKYVVASNFARTRLIMSSFFIFIVATLSISFWPYATATLPYSAPAMLAGITIGYLLGVRTEKQKLRVQGMRRYMEHFAHIHFSDIQSLTWWSFINFYSVGGGLVLINLVGASNVLFGGDKSWAILTSAFGAFLLGTIVPYLVYLWSLPAGRQVSSNQH